jgi:CDP-diacylglycerol--serine O-phosphatidyltransferase
MKKRKRRGIYLLPNLLTSMSLFSGFYSIVATIDKKFACRPVSDLLQHSMMGS